jgi:hypothetical protein
MSFLEIALRNAARGFRVHPLRGKDAILRGWPAIATTDEAQIRAWAGPYADYNVGVAAGHPDPGAAFVVAVVDSDRLSRLKELAGEHAAEWFHTYSVSSGRPDRAHFYYVMSDGARNLGNKAWSENGIAGNVFELKVYGGQVVAEGSIHPDTGNVYKIVQDLPLIPFPAGLLALMRECLARADSQGRESAPVEGNRNNYLTSVGGKLRHMGFSRDALEVSLLQHNADICQPPLDDEEVKRIAASVARYDVPETPPEITIGGNKPAGDWRSHYHTVEQHDKVGPPSFLIEGFLPVQSIMGIGAFVGQKKTLAALNIAYSLCSGEALFGRYEVKRKPARVLYLGPENGLISFSNRVDRIGLRKYLGKSFFYATMSMPEQTPLGALMPEEVADAAIFIDTAIRYTDGDENDATHMKEFANQAFALIRAGAACVIMLHHSPKTMTKAAELTLENSFRGTGELSAFLSVALAMRTQDMDHEYDSASLLRFVKQRDFEPTPPSFEVTTSRETCRMTFVEGSHGATVAKKSTADLDGKADAAVAALKAHPELSAVKMAKFLKDAGIKRSREWVRLKRGELGLGGVRTSEGERQHL